jgi:hypothetical protein
MSWLPQRWRTQRNAIRHANCNIQWVIKILNAPCTSLWGVCLLECLFIPTKYSSCKHSSRRSCSSPLHVPRWNNTSQITFFSEDSDSTRRPGSSELSSRFDPSFRDGIVARYGHPIGPPIRQDYPLNLSILLSGGKETNKDSVSNCEWSRKSSDWKSSEL